MAEQQEGLLRALRGLNRASPEYQEQCLWQLLNFAYFLAKQEQSELEDLPPEALRGRPPVTASFI